MPEIEFDFKGITYEATVRDGFSNLPKDKQVATLTKWIHDRDVTKGTAGGKGFMHLLSMIERPAQALKVGLKESALGSGIYSKGSIDTTPQEGFFTGAKRGWLGEEAVRTQDFLPEDMPGWMRGVLGFAGDVVTDPVTFSGGLIGKSIYGAAKGMKALTPRPVADMLQKAVQADKVQDFARAINVPIGDSKLVKGVSQLSNKQRAAMDRELAEELPKVQEYLEDVAKFKKKDPKEVHRAFRRWMDRPAQIKITKKMSEEEPIEVITRIEKHNANVKRTEGVLRKETEAILGKDGIDYVEQWANKLEKLMQLERASGIFVRSLIARHYFPRFLTPTGREMVEQGKLAEEFFPSGIPDVEDPLFYFKKEPFRNPRSHWEELEEVNRQKYFELHGREVANPADIPYEDTFFHTDVPLALGMRFIDSAASRQKKFFIDHVTDNAHWTEGMSGADRPFMNVGKWIRKDPDDPTKFQERVLKSWNQDEITKKWTPVEDWVPMSDDIIKEKWVDVKGIPRNYKDPEKIAVNAEVAEQMAVLKAINEGLDVPTQRIKGREAYKKAWTEEDRVSSVFKAPPQVAKQIEHEMQLMGALSPTDDALKKFLKFYDEIQNPWKAWTLAIRPAYHTRNAIGNIFNAYIVTGLGSNIPKAVEIFKDAAKLQYYSRFNGSDAIRKGTAERFINYDKTLRGKGVDKLPKIKDEDWYKPNFSDTNYSMDTIFTEAQNRGINAGHYKKDIVRDQFEAHEYELGRGAKQRRARIIGQQNPAIKFGFAVGGTIEGNARFAIFIDTLRKAKMGDDLDWIAPNGSKIKLSEFGKDGKQFWTSDVIPNGRGGYETTRRLMTKDEAIFDIASNKVKEALFDYSDLSLFERNVMKRLMPFYTWSRKNFPVQLKHLVLNPQRAEKLHLAKEQFEYNTGDMDYSDYGAFWGNRVPVFLGKESRGVVKAFTLLNTIPLVELQRFYAPKQLLLEMGSPFPKEIFEQIANYDTFRDKPVVEFPEEGILGESKDLLGVALPARLWKLAQLLVPLIEINRVNPAGVFGEQKVDPATGFQTTERGWFGWGASRESNPIDVAEAARWVRFFSGFRFYDINLEKQRYFTNKNMLNDLRRLEGKLKYSLSKQENRRVEQLRELIDEIQRQEEIDIW